MVEDQGAAGGGLSHGLVQVLRRVRDGRVHRCDAMRCDAVEGRSGRASAGTSPSVPIPVQGWLRGEVIDRCKTLSLSLSHVRVCGIQCARSRGLGWDASARSGRSKPLSRTEQEMTRAAGHAQIDTALLSPLCVCPLVDPSGPTLPTASLSPPVIAQDHGRSGLCLALLTLFSQLLPCFLDLVLFHVSIDPCVDAYYFILWDLPGDVLAAPKSALCGYV